jgi:hypothetical protein
MRFQPASILPRSPVQDEQGSGSCLRIQYYRWRQTSCAKIDTLTRSLSVFLNYGGGWNTSYAYPVRHIDDYPIDLVFLFETQDSRDTISLTSKATSKRHTGSMNNHC